MVKRRKKIGHPRKRIGRPPKSSKGDLGMKELLQQRQYYEEQSRKEKRAIDLTTINNFLYQVIRSPLSDRAMLASHEINSDNQSVNFVVPFKVLRIFCECVKRMEYDK